MTLTIPEPIASFLPKDADAAVNELIVLDLYRRKRISRGRAAELLSEPLERFLQRASLAGIPYLDLTSDELRSELEFANDFAAAYRR